MTVAWMHSTRPSPPIPGRWLVAGEPLEEIEWVERPAADHPREPLNWVAWSDERPVPEPAYRVAPDGTGSAGLWQALGGFTAAGRD